MKKIMIFFLSIIMGAFIFSCKESGTNPPEEKPPGYQVDIPWPSLADSPWPIYGATPQNTGRSRSSNNLQGKVTRELNGNDLKSCITINKSFHIFFSTSLGKFYSIDSSGQLNWEKNLQSNVGGGQFSPVILYDGFLLIADIGHVYKFDSLGNELWRYNYSFPFVPRINIGKDGTIYLIAGFDKFISLSKDGNLEWELTESNQNFTNATAISPDGATIYLTGNSLMAVDLVNRKIKWKKDYGSSAPLVDAQGNIYVLSSISIDSTRLLSIDAVGNIRWIFVFNHVASNLTMDKNGNIYFGDRNVYSVNYLGNLNWKINAVNNFQPIILDESNNIFVIRSDPHSITVRNLNQNGTIKWETTHQIQNYDFGFGGMVGFNTLLLPGWGNSPIIKIN